MPLPQPEPDPRVERAFLRFARAVAWLTLAAGVVVLAGWGLGSPAVAALGIGSTPTRLASGAAFVVAAVAGIVSFRRRPPRQATRALLALLLVLLAGMSLAARLGVLDLGLHHWVLAGAKHGFDARMPFVVALFFTVLGLRVASDRARDARIADLLSVVLLGIGMAALAAQGVSAADGEESALSPATPGAAALLFLNALAWIAARPGTPLCAVAAARGSAGYTARRLLPPALLLPLVYAWAIQFARGRGFDDAFLIAASAVVTGASIAALIWWTAHLGGRIEGQHEQARELRSIAHTDALTALANRRSFDLALAKHLHELEAGGTALAMLLFDIDHFKSYNDTFGHPAGDEALREAGRILRAGLRPDDHAARVGGEEFAALLAGASAKTALATAERIRLAFAGHPWPLRAVTVSIGVAEASAGDRAETLLSRADSALYVAKQGGRNRVAAA